MARRRWTIGVLLGVGVLINYIDRINLSVAAPQLQEDFHLSPEEIGLRSLARLLMEVSGRHQRPRFESLESLFAAIRLGALGGGRTLHGCRIGRAPKRCTPFGPDTLLISREARRSGGAGGEGN